MSDLALDCPLDADSLHERARSETGLSDFGADDYRERLDVYLTALHEVPNLLPIANVAFHTQISQWLKNRLLLTDLVKRNPAIRDVELAPPVVIAGLPRTGTTHLHQMLAAPPLFRSLPYWESVEPFPLAAEIGVEPDPRRARTEFAIGFVNTAMPHFPLMHEMSTEHIHEEIQLLANDVSSALMETLAYVPRWTDYFLAHDQTSSYEHLALQLRALQHLRGGRRWLLKSPQHLEQIRVLTNVFPDVCVIFTHRDPIPVTLSLITMLTYTARMYASPVPVQEIADAWVDRLEVMFDALLRDRDLVPAARSLDVRFEDFMGDELGTAHAVLQTAGEDTSLETMAAISNYITTHPRGRNGRIDIALDRFGLDEADLRARYAGYIERFIADDAGR
jgi:hypothetical protein